VKAADLRAARENNMVAIICLLFVMNIIFMCGVVVWRLTLKLRFWISCFCLRVAVNLIFYVFKDPPFHEEASKHDLDDESKGESTQDRTRRRQNGEAKRTSGF
jgi:hypothetical protein